VISGLWSTTDGLCYLQGDVGPAGPRGAAGIKGEQVSEGRCLGYGAGEGYTLFTSDASIHRAYLGWFFLETLAPRETLETRYINMRWGCVTEGEEVVTGSLD
jgi:hypothetical protein